MNQLVQLKNENGNVYPEIKSTQDLDSVSIKNAPTASNHAVRLQDLNNKTKDYIIEEYHSGDSYWRKWSNGFAECWKIQFYNTSASFETYGSVFRWNHPFKITFPEGLFINTPYESYSLNYNRYECLWLSSNGYGSTTTSQNIYLMSASKVSYSDLELRISCYAWGSWK